MQSNNHTSAFKKVYQKSPNRFQCPEDHEEAVSRVQTKKQENFKTGRWTDDECSLFTRYYNIYGKNWKMIADHITTRSSEQVRSHAQKFFSRKNRKIDDQEATMKAQREIERNGPTIKLRSREKKKCSNMNTIKKEEEKASIPEKTAIFNKISKNKQPTIYRNQKLQSQEQCPAPSKNRLIISQTSIFKAFSGNYSRPSFTLNVAKIDKNTTSIKKQPKIIVLYHA